MPITQVVHDKSKLHISWDIPTRADFDHVIIKMGDGSSTWDTASTILNNYNLNGDYIYQLLQSGTFNFFIKAVDKLGQESYSPAVVTKTFQIEPLTPTPVAVTQSATDRTKIRVEWEQTEFDIVQFGVCPEAVWNENNVIITKEKFLDYTISNDGVQTFLIKAYNVSGHESAILDIATNATITPATPTAPPTSIVRNASEANKLDVVWNKSAETDIDHYEICYRTWGNKLVVTKETKATFTIADSNTHSFLIRAITVSGISSPTLTLTSNLTLEPTNASALAVAQSSASKCAFNVSFSPSTDLCVTNYIIKYGATWDTATLTYNNVLASPFAINVTAQQNSFVWIKAVNNKGYASATPVSVALNTTTGLTPSAPTNGAYAQNVLKKNEVTLSWKYNVDNDFRCFQVKPLGVLWTDTSVVEVTSPSFTFTIPSTGIYNYVVRVADKTGLYSTDYVATSSTLTLEPSAVSGISSVQSPLDRRGFTFSWTPVADLDFDHYILQLENVTQGTGVQTLSSTLKVPTYTMNITTQDSYKLYVTTVNTISKSSTVVSYSFTPNLTPSAPTNLQYHEELSRKGRGIVTWSKIADADVDCYEVKLSTEDWSVAQVAISSLGTFTVNTTGDYTFNVRAKNIAGFYSSVSSLTQHIVVEPSDVSTFTATQSARDKRIIDFNWSTISDLDVDHYVIKKGTSWGSAVEITSLTNNATSFSYAESASGNYTYLIKAVNKQGKESTNAKSVEIVLSLTPSTPTSATTPFQVSPKDKSLIMLAWNGIADQDLVCYQIYCNGELLVETKETNYQYSVYTVGTYTYTVRAKNLAGYNSSFLNIYSGEVTLAPSDVTGGSFAITQSDLDCRTINFSWDKISDTDVSFYEIRKGASWDSAVTVATNVKGNSYQLVVNNSTYADYEGTRTYMVKAVNSIGFYSTTPASLSKAISFTPAPVTSGTITSSTSNRFLLTVSWAKVLSLDIDYYEVTYTPPSGVSSVVYTGKESSFNYDVTEFGGGTHSFSIKVKNNAGFYKSSAFVLSGNITPYPSNVTNFVVEQSALDKRIVNFSWDRNNDTDFSYYEIRKGSTWDAYDAIIASNLTTTTYSYSVAVAESVTYWIKAFNMGGKESQTATSSSNEISLKPSTPTGGLAYHDSSDKSNIQIKWEGIADTDFMNYELKLASSDSIPNEDLSVLRGYPSSTLAVQQENGFWRVARGTDTEILMFKNYTVTIGEKYTESFHFRHDGTSLGFAITFNTNNGHHIVPATVIDEGNGLYFAYASYTVESGATYVRALDLTSFTGNWTYIEIADPKFERVVSVKENFYTFKPNDLTTLSYDFLVSAKNIGGKYSDELWIPFTADFAPSNVSGITAVQSETDHTQIKVSWNAIADKDIAYYVVKRGTDWNSPQTTFTNITQTSVTDTISSQGSYQWMVKAVNKAGVESKDVVISDTFSFDMTPATPANITAVQDTIDSSYVYISWQEQADANAHSLDLREFEVRYGTTWEDSTLIVRTNETHITWQPTTTQLGIKIFVKAKNNAGYYSNEASSVFYNFKLEPNDIENFLAVQNGTSVLFTWDKSSNADVYGYEIREGGNFDGGNIIATGITATQFSLPVDYEVTRIFHIKAINRAGRYSVNADTIAIAIKNLPVKNVINTYNEIPTDPQVYTGTLHQAVFGTSTINCSNIGFILGKYRCSDFTDENGNPTTQCNEIGGSIVLKLAEVSTGVYYSSGYYQTAVKDMGVKVTANIGTQFSATSSIAIGISAKLQYRTSLDNVTWTDWKNFIPVLATFRYIQFQVVMTTDDTAKTPEVPIFEEMVDVPDTDKHGTSVVLAEGNTIYYDPYTLSQAYYETPTVVATALETGKIAIVRQEDIFLDRFVVKVYNYNDMSTPVGGTINWISKGY